jgi:Rad3-related DNA helicase
LSLARRVHSLLQPGGILSSRWRGYEDRGAQRALAHDMARALDDGGVFLAEAPTGIGKSLAYLLPAVLAVQEGDRRVVVATCTKSLQDQLMDRDIPALLEALGISIPCARLKGKQNYLCPQALSAATGSGPEEDDTLEELRRWAGADEAGDLDRFPARDVEAYGRLRGRLGADPAACTSATCRRGRECFWVRARRRAAEAKLLVVNHALLALAAEAESLLPPFDLLVVDEAHRLEGVLLSQLERSASRHRCEEALRSLGSGRRGSGGLASRVRGYLLPLFDDAQRADLAADVDEAIARGARAREDVERFFALIEPQGSRDPSSGRRERYRSASELLGADLEPLETLLSHCSAFSRKLSSWAQRVTGPQIASGVEPSDTLAAELEHGALAWAALGADLENLAEAGHRDWVYWRSFGTARGGSGRGVELHGSPVHVGGAARRLMAGRATVLTSATLSAAGDFGFTVERLGLGEDRGLPCETQIYPSPFPLESQIRAFAWTDPGREEAESVAQVVAALAERTGRSMLVLFTAHERLRRARERLRALLPPERTLLAQEWDGSASMVSERFRAERGAILLGVQSLWEGVDFPGDALEILVVAKLPFSVPDDPLMEARGERLRERGLDPFRADALPEAVLRFRQGVGRLIRRADDRGVLVVCDPRLVSASYRQPFLAALPVAPTPMADAQSLAAEAAAFLVAGEPETEPVAEGA